MFHRVEIFISLDCIEINKSRENVSYNYIQSLLYYTTSSLKLSLVQINISENNFQATYPPIIRHTTLQSKPYRIPPVQVYNTSKAIRRNGPFDGARRELTLDPSISTRSDLASDNKSNCPLLLSGRIQAWWTGRSHTRKRARRVDRWTITHCPIQKFMCG